MHTVVSENAASLCERVCGGALTSVCCIVCFVLQNALIDHCQQWQRHLTTLLNENASKELEDLNNFMVSNAKLLVAQPQDLRSLSSSLNLLKDMKLQAPSIEARFQPLDDMYACLAKFDVQVRDGDASVAPALCSVAAAVCTTRRVMGLERVDCFRASSLMMLARLFSPFSVTWGFI